ncbi:MAG TPA: TonB-dependent receptor plug domain-containing protein [Accumulibacter sp.]|uniref:TonB-dependent receptor n=1 Tax=Accumulibacter sp. TaxID=2053492 RepID=UPI002B5F4A93|nr:TonB-dependent receptor [Accumulibacter sp.]HRF74045.1 TonB-dependent receptor plug domain-containing protein [Accumulibacter sp.]
MKLAEKRIVAAVVLAVPAVWRAAVAQEDAATATMQEVVVSASRIDASEPLDSRRLGAASLAPYRAATSDSARLLDGLPGVSLYGAGGVSSLPVIRGLADDRIRIQVDGMDLVSSCANHMNPPLSYIDPTHVGSVSLFAGVTPVSAGGDSIAGTILVGAPPPAFAKTGEGTHRQGQAGAFYRSNGSARGANLSATVANEMFSANYSGSTAQAGNYSAGDHFKAAGPSDGTTVWLAGDEVGSSSYKSENQSLSFALRHAEHLLELKFGYQHIPYQGFPNQRMDMTLNDSQQVNLRYLGQYPWGSLEARAYHDQTRHKMNFLEDKLQTIGTMRNPAGMPMETKGTTTGATLKAEIVFSERDLFRVGSEVLKYHLDDWWEPISPVVAMPMAGMKGSTFWNINDGQRNRFDVYGEWEARWSEQWLSQLGLRSSTVAMDTGNVQGYNTPYYGNPANPSSIPGAFNYQDHQKTDHNVDLAALLRFTPSAEQTFEAGLARKTRSPNLYERYAWSTNNPMAMSMVNWFGDGNGYVGNLELKPEVAHTVSASASWHDATGERWGVTVSPYYTHVEDYVDALRCSGGTGMSPCQGSNLTRSDGFVYLQFVNQSARLYGADVSGHFPLLQDGAVGSVRMTAVVSYVRGTNTETDDNLYHIMPLNAKLALVQRSGNWTNTVEGVLVGAKSEVSQVRNELATSGYGLLNLRSSYEWKQLRIDLGVENVFDRFYESPLGGAYLGQRPMVYGTAVPGTGRSIYAGLNLRF